MKKHLFLLLTSIIIGSCLGFAQMPIQGPGPANFNPPPPMVQNGPLPPPPSQPLPQGPLPPAPNPQTPPGWSARGYLTVPPSADWMNQGNINVMATGYDSEGVLMQIPLFVSYNYNGVNYNVMVLNSWNPYTQTWDNQVDIPANSTDYYFNGFKYNYFAALPVGNFYFNL